MQFFVSALRLSTSSMQHDGDAPGDRPDCARNVGAFPEARRSRCMPASAISFRVPPIRFVAQTIAGLRRLTVEAGGCIHTIAAPDAQK
jgi:hypothetical protein